MNIRTTLLLLLLAAATVVGVVYSDRWLSPTKVLAHNRDNPVVFEQGQVDEVNVTTPAGILNLKVRDLFWRVGAPVDDVADADRVAQFLKALREAEWMEQLDEASMTPATWEMTGLGITAAHVEIKGAGYLLAECWVGHAAAIDGACYISLPPVGQGHRRHFIARTPLPALIKITPEQWRDSTLLHMPAESVSSITLQNGHGIVELKRSKPSAPWTMTKPLKTRGNDPRINELLGVVLNLKVTASSAVETASTTVPEGALKIAIATPALPTPLELVIAPTVGGETAIESTEATAGHRKGKFTVSNEKLGSLWAKVNDLRDSHLTRIDAEKLYALSIKGPTLGEVALRKSMDIWRLKRHGAWAFANGDRLARLITELNDHQVIAFASDSAATLEPYGLNAPFVTLSWAEGTADNPQPVPSDVPGGFAAEPELKFVEELSFGSGADGKWYAKNAAEPFVYQVSPQVINYVPRDSAAWRSLFPARFTQFALKQVAISLRTNPPVILNYDPNTAAWTGSVANKDISALIDRVKADAMVSRLAGLKADDWLQDRTDAAKALATPELSIKITLLEDPMKPQGATKAIDYNFAPTKPGVETPIFFGRVGSEPDMFIIMREQLLKAVTSVMKQPSASAKK